MADGIPQRPGEPRTLAIDSSLMLPDGPSPPAPIASDAPRFHKERHVKYWLRCFTQPLPHQYQANDASLLSLTFFTISALDLLGVICTRTSAEERQACVDGIYACQHPDGGFRGFRGTDLGARRTEANKVWDPANLPACYFGLSSLLILGDNLSRVDKAACLGLLCRLQRPDGSFGEYLGHDGKTIMGGTDSRYGYCAMAVRWILRGSQPEMRGKAAHGCDDIDMDAFVRCIQRSVTYDGGVSEQLNHEAHAGFTYCAVAAMSLAGWPSSSSTGHDPGLRDHAAIIEWLILRLTRQLDEVVDRDGGDDSHDHRTGYFDGVDIGTGDRTILDEPSSPTIAGSSAGNDASSSTTPRVAGGATPLRQFQKMHTLPESHVPSQSSPPPEDSAPKHWTPLAPTILPPNPPAGFSGRTNKPADTCYAFWASASIALLLPPSHHLTQVLDPRALQVYLLGHSQHAIAGGFGKFPGDPPDIYHSYMGLAALSVLKTDDDDRETRETEDLARPIHRLDAGLCLSARAREWCEQLEWRRALLGQD